jgi:hypothetical protein
LISLPEQNPLGERDAETHRQRTNLNLNVEFARPIASGRIREIARELVFR